MTIDAQIKALYEALKAMKPKDMSDTQYEVFCLLESQLAK